MFKKIWNWIKKNLGIVIAFIGGIITFSIFRSNSDRRGISDCDEGLRRIQEDTERAEQQNNELGKRLDDCQDRAEAVEKRLDECARTTEGIKQDNKEIGERLDRSIEILKNAKERTEKGKN